MCLKRQGTHPSHFYSRKKSRITPCLPLRVLCVCVCVCVFSLSHAEEKRETKKKTKKNMATQHERDALFNALFRKKGNKLCFDCNTPNPKWTSKTFCVFVCLDCSGVHRSLGVHISAVKSANMDRWTTEELDTFKASGGNDAARAFFSQHGWNSNERGKR